MSWKRNLQLQKNSGNKLYYFYLNYPIMSNTIKNIGKIAGYLSDHDIEILESGAALFKRHSNITFKILSADDSELTVATVQEKHLAGQYISKKDLISKTKQLFHQFLQSHKVHVHATPYEPSPVEAVDDKWVNKQMLATGIRIKDMSRDMGIDKTNLSHLISGAKPMSQHVKAMFYFYFMSKSGR